MVTATAMGHDFLAGCLLSNLFGEEQSFSALVELRGGEEILARVVWGFLSGVCVCLVLIFFFF